MSFRRDGDTVTLTMTYDDWQRLVMCLGSAAGAANLQLSPMSFRDVIELTNRLREGAPDFGPIEVPEPAAAKA